VNSVYLDWLLTLLSMGSPKHLMTLLHYMQGQRAEACFVNSVYLDNSSLELYHGLLDKKPGATTMRIRCAGKRHQRWECRVHSSKGWSLHCRPYT